MPMPPIPMDPGMDLESAAEPAGPEATDVPLAGAEDLDPQFAADLAECSYFADATDEDLACIQRAVLGLMGRG